MAIGCAFGWTTHFCTLCIHLANTLSKHGPNGALQFEIMDVSSITIYGLLQSLKEMEY